MNVLHRLFSEIVVCLMVFNATTIFQLYRGGQFY